MFDTFYSSVESEIRLGQTNSESGLTLRYIFQESISVSDTNGLFLDVTTTSSVFMTFC